MVKSVLYEETITLGTGIDFWKGLGTSEPWGNYCGYRWRKETVETRGRIHNIAEKKHEKDLRSCQTCLISYGRSQKCLSKRYRT